jgi:hypothetical protein
MISIEVLALAVCNCFSFSGLKNWSKCPGMPKCPHKPPAKNSIFTVGALDIAGLVRPGCNPEKELFFRQEAAELWNVLDSFAKKREKNGLDILGSPGVGKSCEVWAWLCCQSLSKECVEIGHNFFALWVHIFLQTAPKCVIFNKEQMCWRYVSLDEANILLKKVQVKYLVLDGYRGNEDRFAKLRESAYLNLQSGNDLQIITVMSMAQNMSPEDNDVLGIDNHEVGPWTENEQVEACAHPTFLHFVQDKLTRSGDPISPDQVQDAVGKKHYYAGGSARWMFAFTFEDMLADIEFHLSRVPNANLLLEGFVGVSSQQSNNHLMTRYKKDKSYRVFLASKHVASCLLSTCDASVYRFAYNMASLNVNPAFLGWVVEFDFLSQMKSCAKKNGLRQFEFVPVDKGSGSGTVWDVPGVIDFDPDEDFDKAAMPLGTWLKPVKWNQEGYDLTGLFCDDGDKTKLYLRFVQITNSLEHIANMQHFKHLTERVERKFEKVVEVEIVLVSPVAYRGRCPTKIEVKNGGALSTTRVRSAGFNWTPDKVQSSILQLFFVQQNA